MHMLVCAFAGRESDKHQTITNWHIHSLVSQSWQIQLQLGQFVLNIVLLCSLVACTESQRHIRIVILH